MFKLNKKGFAASGVIYTILILFLVIMVSLLNELQNRKTLLDKLKADTVNAVETDASYEYLLNKVTSLENTVNNLGTTQIVGFKTGTFSSGNNVTNAMTLSPGKWMIFINVSGINKKDFYLIQNGVNIQVFDDYYNKVVELTENTTYYVRATANISFESEDWYVNDIFNASKSSFLAVKIK